MKKTVWLICILLVLTVMQPAIAETFDVSIYSYEELLSIRDTVNETILAMEKQYAIENGNREILFEETDVLLFKGKSKKLSPVVRRVVEDAPETTVLVYASSDPAIAEVSSSGTITALSAGDCVVTCSAKDDENIFSTLPVHVALKVTGVELNAETAELLLTEKGVGSATLTLAATVRPEDAHVKTLTWKTSDESIVTVDENGNVQAHAPGSATITATSDDEVSGNQKAKSASCKITVLRAVNSIRLNETKRLLYKDSTLTLEADVLPQDASETTIEWESSDPEVVAVSAKGQLTGKECGAATIIAKATDGSEIMAICEVKVIQRVTGAEMSESKAVLLLNSKDDSASRIQLVSTAQPENVYVKSFTWTSSDESIATVDENGNVQAQAPGTVTITATSDDEPAKNKEAQTATCKVEVRKAASRVELDETKLTMNKGKKTTLTATVLPEDATEKDVEWVSSNPDVITITTKGQMTAKACGNSTITAKATDGSEVYATCEVNVIQMVTSLKTPTSKVGVSKGETYQLEVTTSPQDATAAQLKWISSNTDVATVENGEITAKMVGITTITASTTDGSELSKEISVAVEPVNGVEVVSMWRKTRWGVPTSIAIVVENRNAVRTIESFDYMVTCYSAYGTELGTSWCSWAGKTIRPGAEATSKYGSVNGMTYAQRFEIKVLSITYTDGQTEWTLSDDAETAAFSW